MSGTTTGSGIWTPRPLGLGVSVPLIAPVTGSPTSGDDRFDGDATLVANAFGVVVATLSLGPATHNYADGGAGDDLLNGNGGSDTLLGGSGADTLSGGIGHDNLAGGVGADVIDGGDGIDWANYGSSATAVVVNLGTGLGSAGDAAGDTLIGIERVYGSNFNDSITGSLAAERLQGNAGNDTIIGGGGIDVLIGGAGADSIVGGGQADLLEGGSGSDTLVGADGNDTLAGGAGADSLVGGAGLDFADYRGSLTGIVLNIGTGLGSAGDAAGDTLIGIERVLASNFNDSLLGGNANEVVRGYGGNDTILGGGGFDTLDGGAGADSIVGGAQGDGLLGGDGADTLSGQGGRDALLGGAGADSLEGGTGADRFLWTSSDESLPTEFDTVADFNRAEGDQLDLSAFGATWVGMGAFIGGGTASAGWQSMGADAVRLVLDANGDGAMDLAVAVLGVTSLGSGDVIL